MLLPEPVATAPTPPSNPADRPVTFTPPVVPAYVPAPTAEATDPASEIAPPPVRTPTVVRRPAVVAPGATPRTTLGEFQKTHPAATKPSSAIRPASAKPPRIDMDAVLTPAGGGTSSAPTPNAAEVRDADAYLSRLLAKLRAAHQKPAGLDAGLRVRVEFSLRADGSLADVRLVESSGSREFDESVLAAFRRVAGFGALPQAFGKTNRVTFRTDAEN